VIDANGLALAHVYGQPPAAIAFSDQRLTDDEAEKLARLIVRLPELVELERERNKAKSRRRSPPPSRPVTLGDLAREGKLLEVECSVWQATPSPLLRATVARIAEAAAGAGCGEPSRMQRLGCQE
jgi:hypothetical protein